MIGENVTKANAMNPDESPMKIHPDNSVEVELHHDHPGFNDPVYRRRRNEIAAIAVNHKRGEPIPEANYTDEEHEVWSIVHEKLTGLYPEYACKAFVEGFESLALPSDHIPQLNEISEKLKPLSGFQLDPVAGLVTAATFYGALADSYFLATQYVRHHSVPLYTPEPDIIHEVIGHANMLAHPNFARMAKQAGEASKRLESPEAMDFLSRVFWFTIEFGILREDDKIKAYGAGILSSFGETEAFRDATIHDFDIVDMGFRKYDISHYQVDLYCAPSYSALIDTTSEFFETFDDEYFERYRHRHEKLLATA